MRQVTGPAVTRACFRLVSCNASLWTDPVGEQAKHVEVLAKFLSSDSDRNGNPGSHGIQEWAKLGVSSFRQGAPSETKNFTIDRNRAGFAVQTLKLRKQHADAVKFEVMLLPIAPPVDAAFGRTAQDQRDQIGHLLPACREQRLVASVRPDSIAKGLNALIPQRFARRVAQQKALDRELVWLKAESQSRYPARSVHTLPALQPDPSGHVLV